MYKFTVTTEDGVTVEHVNKSAIAAIGKVLDYVCWPDGLDAVAAWELLEIDTTKLKPQRRVVMTSTNEDRNAQLDTLANSVKLWHELCHLGKSSSIMVPESVPALTGGGFFDD